MQLLGVLREVVAGKTPGTALTSAASVLFEAPAITSEALEWNELPALRVDTSDPQYAWLSNISVDDPGKRLDQLRQAPVATAEVRLAQAHAALELRRRDLVEQIVNEMLTEDPWEWRAVWVAGLAALDAGDFASAQSSFNAVYGQVPGELAPNLRWPWRVSVAVRETSRRGCTGPAPAPTPTMWLPPRSGWRASEPRAATCLAPSRPWTWCHRQAGATPRRVGCGRQLYESGHGLPALAQAMDSISGVRLDPREQSELTAQIWSGPSRRSKNGSQE